MMLSVVQLGTHDPIVFSLSDVVLFGLAAALSAAFLLGRYWRSRELLVVHRARERYRLLAEHASDMLSTHAADGTFIYASPALERLLGHPTADLRGRMPTEFAHPEDVGILVTATQKALRTGQPVLATWRCRGSDGAYAWLETNGRAIPEGAGPGEPRFVAASRNVTRRKQVEAALRASEQRFRTTLEASNLVAVAVDATGRVTFCNDSLLVLTGWSRDDLMGADWFAHLGAAAESWHHSFLDAIANGTPAAQHEVEVLARDGRLVLIAWEGTLLREPNGDVSGAAYLGVDITERRGEELAMQMLNAITMSIGAAESFDQAVRATLERVCESTGWPYGEFWLLDDTGVALERAKIDFVSPGTEFAELTKVSASMRFRPGDGLAGAAHAARRAIWLDDRIAQSCGPRIEIARRYGLEDGLGVPVLAGEHVVAVMTFFLPKRGQVDDRNMQLVALVAKQLGTMILRKRAEEQLRLEQERFRSAFEYSGIGMALVAPDGRWLRVNRSVLDIVGYTEEELLSRTFQDITHPDDLEADLELIRQVLASEIKSYHLEKRYIHRDGHIVWVRLTVSLVRDPLGVPLYFISQLADVSDAKRHETEILRARDAAESANRSKSEFLARMSHELRTPLNSVIGFSRLLQKRSGSTIGSNEIQLLERIGANGQHLLALINDILDLSRIESGRVDVALQTTALVPLIRDVLSQIDVTATAKGLQVVCQVPDGAVSAEIDGLRFRQVLLNLIGNAVKFTETGSITVRLHVDRSMRPLRLDICDTGVGIPADRVDAVFEPFEQADASTSRKHGGTGLGLSISRAYCEAMGLRLTLHSELGKGSTFAIAWRREALAEDAA